MLHGFGEITLTISEHGSLHGSVCPVKHGYHGIKDDMADATGTSGWTHVDARWVPRSYKKTVLKRSIIL